MQWLLLDRDLKNISGQFRPITCVTYKVKKKQNYTTRHVLIALLLFAEKGFEV